MKYGVYCVENTLSGFNSGLYIFPTDKMASVSVPDILAPRNLASSGRKDFITDEFRLFRVGAFDVETRELFSQSPSLIPWDFRRFMEVPSSPITPQQFEAHASEVSN